MLVVVRLLCLSVWFLLLTNVCGDGTEPKYSNKPESFSVGKVTDTSIDLSWTKPKNPSAVVTGYHLYYKRGEYPATKNVDELTATVHYRLSNLQPFTYYEIWVTTSTEGDSDPDTEPSERLTVKTDVSAPSPPRITNITCLPTNSIFLQWQRPTEFFNSIDLYYINYREENSPEFEKININSSKADFETYIITNLTEDTTYEVRVAAASQSAVYYHQFNIGKPSEAKKILVKSACDEVEQANLKIHNMILITVVSFVVFVISLVVISVFIWRHCFHAAYYYLEESRQLVNAPAFDWDIKTDPPAVTVDEFEKHVQTLHADGDIGFSKEYESIQCTAVPEQFSSEVSVHPENKLKNRYLNILAYDHSRVRLVSTPGQNRWVDYINANFIDGFEKTNAYIGTQGPLPSTFDSFWRMVWEQGVSVIVMITNLVERGRRKCDMYWPKEGVETYGHIQVKMIKEDVLAMYTVRTLKICHIKLKRKKYNSVERVVHQFHYTNWHDHGTPDHPLPILSFVNKSSTANQAGSGPIVVHCSAGVGRTGTYIVLDAMLKQIRAKNEVNIYGYLRYIRNQRNYLVQTEEQYIFIHDALLEAINFAKNALSTECILYLSGPSPEPDSEYWTQFEANYKMVISFEPKEYHQISGNKPCNHSKNRSQDLVPIESSRVHLTPKPGIDGSDYINASWILGFRKLKEFIITQHPLEGTIIDFWQMIWDHNAQTVVLLSAIDEPSGYPVFWPTDKETTLDSETFKVRLIEESELDGTLSRDYTVQSLHDDYELTVRIIQPLQHITDVSHIVSLINVVQQYHIEYQNGPIVVADELGGTVAATFCCLSTLNKQLEYDSNADVSIYAKLYHNQRPGVWKTIDDYLTLYRGLNILSTNKGVSLVASPDPYIHINYGCRYTNGNAFQSS